MSETQVRTKRRSAQLPITYVVAVVPVAAALNIVGGYINTALRLPTFLDMIGTMVSAILLGPWWGAVVGVITNVVSSFLTGPIGLPFAVCNVIGALVWGYANQWGWMKKQWSFFLVNMLAGLMVTLFAVPIYVFLFGGATGHFSDVMTAAFLGMGQHLIVSVFSSNVLVNLADKIISGYVGLAIIEALPANLTSPTAQGNRFETNYHSTCWCSHRCVSRFVVPCNWKINKIHSKKGDFLMNDKKTVGPKEGLGIGIICLGVLMAFLPGAAQNIADLPFIESEPFPILLGSTYVLALFVVLAGLAVLLAKFNGRDEE